MGKGKQRQEHKSLEEILLSIRENQLTKEVKDFLPFNLDSLEEENIVGCVVSNCNNEEFLKDLPFIPAGDFAVVFKYYIKELEGVGAFTILYKETKEMLLQKFNGNIILIPVSTNEWLLLSEDKEDNFGDLEKMILKFRCLGCLK